MPAAASVQLLTSSTAWRRATSGELEHREPDAKDGVRLLYENGIPTRVLRNVVVSHQHKRRIGLQIATSKRMLKSPAPAYLR